MKQLFMILVVSLSLGTAAFCEDAPSTNRPQAAGLNHNWAVTTRQPVPDTAHMGAEKNENIRWKLTLPEGEGAAAHRGRSPFHQRLLRPPAG